MSDQRGCVGKPVPGMEPASLRQEPASHRQPRCVTGLGRGGAAPSMAIGWGQPPQMAQKLHSSQGAEPRIPASSQERTTSPFSPSACPPNPWPCVGGTRKFPTATSWGSLLSRLFSLSGCSSVASISQLQSPLEMPGLPNTISSLNAFASSIVPT